MEEAYRQTAREHAAARQEAARRDANESVQQIVENLPASPEPKRKDKRRRLVIEKLPKRSRLVLLATIGLATLLGGGTLGLASYAHSGYFVRLHNNELAIYKGRLGGFLWFQPTITKLTQVDTSQVLPSRIPDLKSGKFESSFSGALNYITALQIERAKLLQGAPGIAMVSVSKGNIGTSGLGSCQTVALGCHHVVVNVQNFAPNNVIHIACADSSGEFYSYSVTTGSDGSSNTETCLYGFAGATVTVTVDGVSGSVIW